MGERATATIRPVKVRDYNAELHCDVLAVVGYKVECKCGWKSQTYHAMAYAKGALITHRAHGHKPLPEAAQATSETAA